MPIILTNRNYVDVFGNSRTFYKGNAGDRQQVTFRIEENISVMTSPSVNLSLNIPLYEITWLGGDFEDEGFRTGDLIQVNIWDSTGAGINTYPANVVWVNGNTFKISSLLGWYDSSQGEVLQIIVKGRRRQGARLSVNHVQNGAVGNALSLIDGEATQGTFDLTASSPVAVTLVSRQSGQFWWNATFNLTLDNGFTRYYNVVIDFINSGIYDASPFTSSNCLKLYTKISWQSLLGEPYANDDTIISEDANTGWFDEPHNADAIDAVLIQGATAIQFDAPTTVQILVDSSAIDYAFGFAYVPQDDAYFKNVFPNQSTLSGMMSSAVPSGVMNGFFLPNGGYMEMEVVGASQVGTIWTFDIEFRPSVGYTNFMLSKPAQDRVFYAWCKIGNMNLLFYADQLQETVNIGGPIPMLKEDFYDHSENTIGFTATETSYQANVEDDLSFYGVFQLELGDAVDSFTAKLRAVNPMTSEAFDLQTAFFSFATIPQVAGKYIIGETLPLFSQFDTNSIKREAVLKLIPAYDSGTQYGVEIFYPFLFRWEYWLQQLNADADFYPSQQTMNYVPYGNTTPWGLEVRLELLQDGVLYFKDYPVTIKDYDSDPTIDQTIQLFVEATNQPVSIIVEGGLMRVEALHTLNDGTFWTPNVWGMITIEPTENSPRWWCSSAVPFDNNPNNPLTPISGAYCDVSFPNFNQVKLTCFFDPSKINLQNGCKFTSKIKGCSTSIRPNFKFTTYGAIKQTTAGGYKELA